MRKISIAIPTFNRFELLLQSYNDVIGDDRVGEIVISDDYSDRDIFEKIRAAVKDEPKIRLYRNINNHDCYWNKMVSLLLATNDWCILLDSDNIIGRDYLDRIYEFEWNPKMILAPSFARPQFDYRKFAGLTISKENVAQYMDKKMFSTCLNTANFFVNKNEYLYVWRRDVDPVTSDSIFFNYCWLEKGNMIHITEGLEYFHRVHHQSHYQINNHRTPKGFHEEIEQKLKEMRA